MILKVCGITRNDQYSDLERLGVDMIGLNFYRKSPRFLHQPIHTTGGGIKNVGVFVNEDPQRIAELIEEHKLDYLQLHGNESSDECKELKNMRPIIKAFGLSSEFDFGILSEYEPAVDYFLFDTKTSQYGGSGRKFNWELLASYNGSAPFLLSGGIRFEDIDEIKRIEHQLFKGIDVNSGFETAPGIKNIDKLIELKERL